MDDIILFHSGEGFASGKLGEYSFDVEYYTDDTRVLSINFDGKPVRIRKLHVMRGFTLICLFNNGGWNVLPLLDADKDACAKIIRRFN